MSAVRDRTLVVDFGVLPERPKLDIVERLVKKLGLIPTDLRCIQLNNVRHCLLIEMADPATAAAETAKQHHLKHAFRINETTKIAIPVYVDDNTVDVRVHDLPPYMPNLKIAEAMLKYGEVITIRDEVWKNFFVGVPNGVRVLKMRLTKLVPSCITLCEHTTLATYTGQLITCRRCHLKRHPTKSWAEAAKLQEAPKKKPTINPLPPFCQPPIQQ